MKIFIILFSFLIIGCASNVDRGQVLFFSETFAGNGRVCATCHTPGENFSISPGVIRSLPSENLLFVPVPGLENREKLLADGLIFVNDLDDGIVEFRQTPKLTHLRDLCNRKGDCGPLGLRGDRERNLCQFSREAVANHFTKKVNGEVGVDFRFITEKECRDLVAFLISKRVAN